MSNRYPQARPRIGRAGRQEAPVLRLRPVQFAPERVVERINPLPRRVRLQTREDGLQAEVIPPR